jgi:hypothetical protein
MPIALKLHISDNADHDAPRLLGIDLHALPNGRPGGP